MDIRVETRLNTETVGQSQLQKEPGTDLAIQRPSDMTVRHTVMVVDDDSNILDFLV